MESYASIGAGLAVALVAGGTMVMMVTTAFLLGVALGVLLGLVLWLVILPAIASSAHRHDG